MTSYEFPVLSERPSDAERERAIEVLKENAAQGRLSHDTFVRRMELAMTARGRGELAALTADLPTAGRVTDWAARLIGASSSFADRLRRAWQTERLPQLLLPAPGPDPFRIGRDFACGLRIADDSVSRLHAELCLRDGVWTLRDLGSMNGTWVNGMRVMGTVRVRPGDAVTFGRTGYRLTGR